MKTRWSLGDIHSKSNT